MRRKILILDDDSRFLNLLQVSLVAEFDLITADDEEAAKALLKENSFDLFILDFKLKRSDGLQFLEQWAGPYELPPVIVISGYASLQMALGLLNRNIAGFIEKPAGLDDIRKKIHEVFAKTMKTPAIGDIFDMKHFTQNAGW